MSTTQQVAIHIRAGKQQKRITTATAAATEKAVTSNFDTVAAVRKAMLRKLEDSVLSAADARTLGFTPYTAQEVASELRELEFKRAGFQIPYFDLSGRRTKFYRFRYLEYDNGRGFARLVHNGNGTGPLKHDIRYVQPANTVPEPYLSPAMDWPAVFSNVAVPLVITEGELKAACACKHKLACMGLGGVWNFKSAREGTHLLPVFAQIKWAATIDVPNPDGKGTQKQEVQRDVYICYDSDSITNANVCMAENKLAHELTALGALVHICRIPALDGKKTGIDDYIAHLGFTALLDNVINPACAPLWSACAELFRLNEEVIYVRDPGLVLRLDTLQRMTASAFVEHQYSNRIWRETVVSAKGDTKLVERSAPREWLKWPHRASIERTTYKPGEERFLAGSELNLWPGWGCKPAAEGDVTPWLDYLDYVFADHDDKEFRVKWFQQWLAYPLQHPGTKLNQSVVMWSVDQGTGKSVIGYLMQEIYGKNFTEISDKHLQGNFNSWAENKQFVMGDEIASTGDKRRDTADRMKSIITQRELHINVKFVPEYAVPDCINYYFTSNHCDAFFVDDTDRRFFVNEIKRRPRPAEWYKQFCTWALRGGVGAGIVFAHLLTFDLTDFDPQGHAPVTTSKRDMIASSRTDAATWVARLKEDPDSVLRIGEVVLPHKLWTAEELFRIYDPEGRGKLTVNGLARELRRGGFKQVRDSTLIRTKTRGLQRIWAIRDRDAMLVLGQPAHIAEIFDRERADKVKGAKY